VTVPSYAIIPTHDRTELVTALVKNLREQGCTHVIVIDNDTEPVLSALWFRAQTGLSATVIREDESPPNLYALWNRGFAVIEQTARILGERAWNVVVLNDDTELPTGWLAYVCHALEGPGRERKPAVACTYAYGNVTEPLLKTRPDDNIITRMCPWAFVVRGELGLRADEDFRWWYGDNDFEYIAIQSGGVLLLPGYTTKNLLANSTTVGALAEQAGRDRETFTRKWGSVPW
jgi:hypothetical protein